MRKIKKGSFTVEAALLMPVIFLVLMGLLYLNFYVHNRAWLTAAAYEAAVSGSMEGYSKNAIAEAFECLPETVTARIKRAEEDMNGT